MPCASSNELCLECGLCCNGVIFAGVRLEPEDDAGLLRSLGLPVAPAGTGSRRGGRGRGDQSTADRPGFRQPCAALKGCRCRIYADRPKYCREFECRLLKNMQAGRLEKTSARRVIRATLGRVEEVRRLLLELGDADDARALSLRFRRVKKRLESASADPESAEIFSRLTLAVHGLNLCLGESFYPGPAQG
jgi:Fe-S-cluster containining protein